MPWVTILVWVALLAFQPAPPAPPTFVTLANLAYDLGPDDERDIQLKDGRWTDPEAGGSTFTLMNEHAFGDLDGDRVPDAAAMLVEETTGTGRFYALFVFMNRGGKLEQLESPELLGDRSVIQRVTIDRRGTLAVRFMTHVDNDPPCCPTLRAENKYRVVNGKLIPQ
jgi:hypothetical protein